VLCRFGAKGEQNIRASDERVGKTINQAYEDATEWIKAREQEPEQDLVTS
jgi:hypothetical protein